MTTTSRTAHLRITPQVKRMTLERWQKWKPTDGWKYDWTNGETVKYKKMVSQEQRYIVDNLQRLFAVTTYYQQRDSLLSECEVRWDVNRYRVPDLAYFTHEQNKLSAQSIYQTPSFIIEILSPTDNYTRVQMKLKEYFDEGVKTIWHIYPPEKTITVYTSLYEVKIYHGNMICSALPALSHFEVSVTDVFAL
jgi:Uma2 family endonuclease